MACATQDEFRTCSPVSPPNGTSDWQATVRNVTSLQAARSFSVSSLRMAGERFNLKVEMDSAKVVNTVIPGPPVTNLSSFEAFLELFLCLFGLTKLVLVPALEIIEFALH